MDAFETCPKCRGELCPVCGEHLESGYGLMGGGCGVYWFCSSAACEYFYKIQDADENAVQQ